MLRNPGCMVEQGNFGAGDNSAGGIGDQATDAAPAGLGKRGSSRTEDQNPRTEKNPHRRHAHTAVFHGHPSSNIGLKRLNLPEKVRFILPAVK
jgi:hypothetical protein